MREEAQETWTEDIIIFVWCFCDAECSLGCYRTICVGNKLGLRSIV
jgi:hypothetical protein